MTDGLTGNNWGRRWKILLAVGLVAAVTASYIAFVGNTDGEAAENDDTPAQVNATAVVRTDLVELEQFDGTLRSVDDVNIVASTSGTITAVASEGTALDEGDMVYAVDGTAVPLMYAPNAFYRDLSLGDDIIDIEAVRSGTVTSTNDSGAIIEQGDELYAFDGEPVTVLYGESVAYRDLYWPEPPDSTTRSTLASDVQSEQNRARLVEAIAEAEDLLDEALADVPSNALLNAIDDLTNIERAGGTDSEISRANQAVTAAQQADLDRIAAAEEAVDAAYQAVVDFDEVEAASALDEVANENVIEAEPNLIGQDVLQLETALVAMGYDPDGELVVDREFTSETEAVVEQWQRDLGVEVDGIVQADDIVFVPGPVQIVEMVDATGSVSPGVPIATLSTGTELEGPDVLQLEQALARLGFTADDAMVVDDVFTEETRRAVTAWQVATGQEPDGILHIGDVVVAEAAIRVVTEMAPVGTEISPGSVVLQASDLEQIVSFDLDAGDQEFADEGDQVTVILPGDRELGGVVEEIATTATTTPEGDTVFEVTIRLDDPDAAGDLTEAPVDVELVGSSVTDVLAVPVSALVALSDGGYAVEADSGSGFRLVAVEPGFFADGLVEIDVESVDAGDQVRLP